MRLETKEETPRAARPPGPLLRNFDALPLIKERSGAPKLKITPMRIHELEMEAEMGRHEGV